MNQSRLVQLLPILIIALLIAGYMLTGYLTLDEDQRRVPILTGYVTLLLLAIEAFRGKWFHGPESPDAENKPAAPLSREVMAILYVGGFVAGIYLVGYLVTIPLYLFASLAWLGRQPPRLAAIITVSASLAIYLIFELMLEYRLFDGLLFS